MSLKLMVIGHGRHGKDTVKNLMANCLNITGCDSSWFVCEEAVFPLLKDKYGYATPEECYNDRHNHRSEWFDAICAFNADDKAALAKRLFAKHDIYCGLRNAEEFKAAKNAHLFHLAIWVDASDRLPPEDESSCTVTKAMADIVIDNNGTEEELVTKVLRLCLALKAGGL